LIFASLPLTNGPTPTAMSRDHLNAGSYNHESYSRPSAWPPANLQDSQDSQPMQAPQASAGGVSYEGPYGFPTNRHMPPGTSFGMPMMSPVVVDDRQFFQRTPVPSTCYSPFGSSEGSSDTRPSTGMDSSEFQERSTMSSPSTSVNSHVGPSSLRTEVGASPQSTSSIERPPTHSVRDVRKRAYDLSKRLDNAAQKAGDDAEANLSVLAFSARPDTKDHSNNTPRFYASSSFVEAFRQRGIPDLKSYLTGVAYDSRPGEEVPTPELVATLRQQLSELNGRLSAQQRDMSRIEGEMALLKEENERLRRVAEGHAVVATKLQEVAMLSYDYSLGYAQPGLGGPL